MAANTRTVQFVAATNATMQTALTDVKTAYDAIATYQGEPPAILASGLTVAGTAALPLYTAWYSLLYYSFS